MDDKRPHNEPPRRSTFGPSADEPADIPERPLLRRIALVIYLLVVLCVILGLLLLLFPGINTQLPFEPSFPGRPRSV